MKKKIADAFFTLSKQRGIDKVTVKDLVTECHISRQTFYYHFQDILEVLEWSAEQAVEDALRQCLAADSAEESMKIFIQMTSSRSELMRRLLNSQEREFVEMTLMRAMESYLEKILIAKTPEAYRNIMDKEVVLTFYASGLAGVLMKMLSRGDVDADALSKKIVALLANGFNQFMEK